MRAADGVVLPGVGAMPQGDGAGAARSASTSCCASAWTPGVPMIGICMGMQLLFESTTELGGAEGIGLLGARSTALDAPGLKVPHIGWNPVALAGASRR